MLRGYFLGREVPRSSKKALHGCTRDTGRETLVRIFFFLWIVVGFYVFFLLLVVVVVMAMGGAV